MSDSLDDDDRRYRPVTLSRKYLRSRDSAYALKTLESMSREDLVRAFVKIQTSFVGGRSRSGGLEALVTCGGTQCSHIVNKNVTETQLALRARTQVHVP